MISTLYTRLGKALYAKRTGFYTLGLCTAVMLGGFSPSVQADEAEAWANQAPLENPEDLAPKIENQAQMEAFMKHFILNNPEIIIEAVDRYSAQQKQNQQRQATGAIKDNKEWLYNTGNHPEAGNKDGDITIVEFYDYNCGYCKRALSDVMTVLGEDKNVRVILIDLPILGDASMEAAKWSLAAAKQDRYLELHVALMEHRGRLGVSQIESIAEKMGLDVEKLRADKESDDVIKQLNVNIDKARALGITGTPAFIIGEDLARGYVGLDGLKAGIAQNREKNKSGQ